MPNIPLQKTLYDYSVIASVIRAVVFDSELQDWHVS